MRKLYLLFILCLFLASTEVKAQTIESKIGIHSVYMPKFKVQEASDRNVQAIGLQWMVSGTSRKLPIELGLHLMIGYGRVGSGSFGASLAYIFGQPNNSNIKLGLGIGEVDLKDVDASGKGSGPHIGDVNFTSRGTQFKPYIEFEYSFLSFSAIFIRTGYRIINGEKSVIKAVKRSSDPLFDDPPRVTEREDSIFYSAAGFELGFGISIIIH